MRHQYHGGYLLAESKWAGVLPRGWDPNAWQAEVGGILSYIVNLNYPGLCSETLPPQRGDEIKDVRGKHT